MRTRRPLITFAGSLFLLSCCLAYAQRPAAPALSLQSRIVGTWSLVARDVVHPDGYGPKYPIGYLMYDNTGHMAVQFMGLDRPNDGSARAYDAYFGTYTIDETSNPPKVTHHREGSLNPRDVGGDVVRDLVLNGDELKLVVHNNRNSNVNVNTFRRVK
jgi:Lipocalin-like domain